MVVSIYQMIFAKEMANSSDYESFKNHMSQSEENNCTVETALNFLKS